VRAYIAARTVNPFWAIDNRLEEKLDMQKVSIAAPSLALTILVIAALFYSVGPAEPVSASGSPNNTFSSPAYVAGDATVEIIAVGLNNPRGLNFGPKGGLYVAEAGNGGADACGTAATGNPRPLVFYGPTGSIARLDLFENTYERVITGLPSKAPVGGNEATGPHDIVFKDGGQPYITTGWGADPRLRTSVCGAAGNSFARLISARRNGSWYLQADIGAFEAAVNPHRDTVDSNPYGLLADSSDERTVLVDAGANDLLSVNSNGKISVLAVFPNRLVPFGPPGNMIPMQAVPTSVARGPDGYYYVGQLTGFPFPVGGANVYRVRARGGTPTVYAGGFTNIIDIAFGRYGELYVLEYDKNGILAPGAIGSLIRVAPDGTRTELAPGMLTSPGGIAIGNDGAIYVTNKSVRNGLGEVLRITP